jgi:hypothetical protein
VRVSGPEDGAPLTIGTDRPLTATAEMCDPNDVPLEPVTWSSSEPAVASVSADGLVTGKGEGQARIVATVGGVNGGLNVRVGLPAAGQTVYTVAYVGGSFDTTYRNNGRAILCSKAGIYLNTEPSQGDKDGFIALGTVDFQPLSSGSIHSAVTRRQKTSPGPQRRTPSSTATVLTSQGLCLSSESARKRSAGRSISRPPPSIRVPTLQCGFVGHF